MNRLLTLYYAATLLFLIVDFILGVNVRVAFLDSWPLARFGYYAVCFGCLAVMIWRPQWQALVSAVESLTAIVALTLAMGLRVLVVTDDMIETGRDIVTSQEILNYLISGSVAYYAWYRATKRLKVPNIG